jgi:pilus assembly protein Flp/PilA
MKVTIKQFVVAEEGLETVEYAIIAGLIVVGVIATVVTIGTWVSGKFTAINAGLQGH